MGIRTEYYKAYYTKNRSRILARTSAYNAAHPEQRLASSRRYKEAHPDECRRLTNLIMSRPHNRKKSLARRAALPPELKLYYAAKYRAAKAGVPFDLDKADIVIPALCPVLGIPLSVAVGGPKHSSPSVDRLVPANGYVKGNVAVISHRANSLKSNGTAAEIEKLAAWMRRVS